MKVLKIAKKVAEITVEALKKREPSWSFVDKIQFDRVQNMIDVGIKKDFSVNGRIKGKPHGLEDGWFIKLIFTM